jgi:hypothetical protein
MVKASLSSFRFVLLAVACTLLALPAAADSQARIVRLSDVQGSVRIDKNTGVGFENAFVNLPITQGTQLRTGENGRAEVEFEDGSTLRLAPGTSIEFSTLGLSDAGKHISEINLVEGMAYVNWLGKSGDEFTLDFSQEKISLTRAAHFRVDTSARAANLAVFKGDVVVEGLSGKVAVEKKKTATFDVANNDKYTLASNIQEEPLDSWDKESLAYHDQYAKNNSTPYGYGYSDLNYYGNYTNVPGYGMLWQPYFTGVGWDPFMDGAWAWYPGFGSMFVSAYPWGWMPYRYGNWLFVPGFGWMWQPGFWNSFAFVPRVVGRTPVNFHPPIAPATGTVRTIAVGKGGFVLSPTTPHTVLRGGTAGMGIARGSFSNLRHLNSEVAKNGSVSLHAAPQFSASSGRTSGFGGGHASAPPAMGHSSGGVSAGHVSAGGVHR